MTVYSTTQSYLPGLISVGSGSDCSSVDVYSRRSYPYGSFTYGGFFSDPVVAVDYPLVGSRESKNKPSCGSFVSGKSRGCLETHLHHAGFAPDGVSVFSPDYSHVHDGGRVLEGQAFVVPVALHCSDPLCPICCHSWAKKETSRAVKRFEGFRLLGLSNYHKSIHSTVSVPECDFSLPYEELRKKASVILQSVGVDGGCLIYHSKRYNRRKHYWYFSPHWHSIGLAVDGRVDGQLVSLVHNRTGYVVKNLGVRESSLDVVRTLMYQLSHAGVPPGSGHLVTWFGNMSYNQLSIPKSLFPVEKAVCKLCGSELKLLDRDPLDPFPSRLTEFEDKECVVSASGWRYHPVKHFKRHSHYSGVDYVAEGISFVDGG